MPQDPSREFRSLWNELEAKATAESRFTNAIDFCSLCCTASSQVAKIGMLAQ
ncbi:hypothetical protein [Ensifer sp. 22460]|uniref:hypothetical protein n=1 Tax=Ensifer sp. 22460 TaxID=3453922 RepID=UPI003F82FC34